MQGNSCCCTSESPMSGCRSYQGYDTGRKVQANGDYTSQVCCGDSVMQGNSCCCTSESPMSGCGSYQGYDSSWQTCTDDQVQNTGKKPTPPLKPCMTTFTGKTCMGGQWPSFSSAAELAKNSGWSLYFKSLYGTSPTGPWPLCIGSFWAFWTDKLSSSKACVPESNGQCPSSGAPEGQRYNMNNAYSSNLLTWSWHPMTNPAYNGFPANTLVEVSHAKDPFGDEHYGMWFVYAKGTGIYFDLGNTIIFKEHEDAFKYFDATTNEAMSQKATAQGFDSIQFTAHVDHPNYPCDSAVGAPFMNIEIVAVTLTGTYSCGQKTGTPTSLRQGWGGTLPCNCDNSLPNTNCVLPIQGEQVTLMYDNIIFNGSSLQKSKK